MSKTPSKARAGKATASISATGRRAEKASGSGTKAGKVNGKRPKRTPFWWLGGGVNLMMPL